MSLRVRLVLAFVCALATVAIVALYTAGVRAQAAQQRAGALERYGGETVSVCVTTRDVVRGETFSERNVDTQDWLVDLLPEGAVTDSASLMGKTAAASMARNTPVASVDIEAEASAVEVPAGLVAVSVPATNESAVGGALVSGSVVDVYVVSDGTARLLCQEVQVLQTNASSTSASLSWATLAVDPSDVEAVIAAAAVQRLHFVLPSDEEVERRARAAQAAPTGGDAAETATAVGGAGETEQFATGDVEAVAAEGPAPEGAADGGSAGEAEPVGESQG